LILAGPSTFRTPDSAGYEEHLMVSGEKEIVATPQTPFFSPLGNLRGAIEIGTLFSL
jgi:hypothetical protein